MSHLASLISLAFFSFLLLLRSAYAEPSATVSSLMEEPVTLWDWGLYGLRQDLEGARTIQFQYLELDTPVTPENVYASYEWRSDRIRVRAVFRTSQTKVSRDIGRKLCGWAIQEIRRFFWIDATTGKHTKYTDNSRYDFWFAHEGFRRKSQPADLGEKLEQITELEVTVGREGEEKFERLDCRGRLRSNEVLYSDWYAPK